MSSAFPYPVLSHFGVELEYMIVSTETLRAAPIADRILPISAEGETDIPHGILCWSNELVRHVVEFKNPNPTSDIFSLLPELSNSVRAANQMLSEYGACILPTGIHPDFRPLQETVLWPHGNHEIYQRFHQMFDCRGHGWSNLQSAHLNVSFGNEDEFVRLHAVIRLLLPLMPALAASTPIIEGHPDAWKCARIRTYRENCARIPIITAGVIPENIRSFQDYEERIYTPIREAIAPWNEDQLLDPIWVNARGAIARIDRGSIEIRVLDLQECPKQDIALLGTVIDLLRALYDSDHSTEFLLQAPQKALEALFVSCAQTGTDATVPTTLSPWLPLKHNSATPVIHVAQSLLRSNPSAHTESHDFLQLCATHGNLAERILASWEATPDWQHLAKQWIQCLAQDQVFL
jgi:carboxylate-amine ligase